MLFLSALSSQNNGLIFNSMCAKKCPEIQLYCETSSSIKLSFYFYLLIDVNKGNDLITSSFIIL